MTSQTENRLLNMLNTDWQLVASQLVDLTPAVSVIGSRTTHLAMTNDGYCRGWEVRGLVQAGWGLEVKMAAYEISTVNEKSLHADLKKWYEQPHDRFEVLVDGFIIDIVRGDLLIEIQTKNFWAIKNKLIRLVKGHPVRLVCPIERDKWIVKLSSDGQGLLERRRSPKKGLLEDVFEEMVTIPELLAQANFSVEVLLIQEEENRRYDETHGWRRKGWVTHDRRLLQVMERRVFETPAEMATLIPNSLDEKFSTADLSNALAIPRWLAQKMAYCFREMDAIEKVGKVGNSIIYKRKR